MKYINNSNKAGSNKGGSKKKFKKFNSGSSTAASANLSGSSKKNVALKSRLTPISRKNPSLFSVLIRNSLFIKIAIIAIITIVGVSTCCFFINKINKKYEVLPAQANFLGVDISNRNREQIENLIKDDINPKLSKLELTFKFDDSKLKIRACDYNFQVDSNDFFNAAKKTNFTNNEAIKPKLKCDENALQNALENFSQTSKILPSSFSYSRTGKNVIVSAGNDGKTFNVEKNKKKIFEVFSNFEDDATIDADYDIIKNNNKAIDFKLLQKKLECTPKNACLTSDSTTGKTHFEKEQEGVHLPDTEQSKIKNPSYGTYKLTADILKPEITTASLKEQLKKDPAINNPIATFSTSISKEKPRNTIHNIQTAANAINGIILLPGERFSFNAAIKRGGGEYKKATVFDRTAPNGQREDIGGGICQVSSTLFGAALRANLNIVERHCHSYEIKYVGIGQDATVSDGGKDLVFENNRRYAIKIKAHATNSGVTTTICGNQKPNEKVDVSVESKITAKTPTYINAQATQTVRQNGSIIKQRVYNSHYYVRKQDIERELAAEARKAKAAQEAEAKKAEELKKAQEAEAKQAEELNKKAHEAEVKKAEVLKKPKEVESKKTEEIKKSTDAEKSKAEMNTHADLPKPTEPSNNAFKNLPPTQPSGAAEPSNVNSKPQQPNAASGQPAKNPIDVSAAKPPLASNSPQTIPKEQLVRT